MNMKLAAAASAGTIAFPVGNAIAASKPTLAAATPKKVVSVTKTVSGSQAIADRWGALQVTLVVKKTTTTVGTKKTITRKITSVKVPVYPNHTDRSVFINQQALPMLEQETLKAQFTGSIQMISGASDSSNAFIQSLQSALISAKKV
ncbi:MAG: hypothetical protein QOI27_323 [Gaiellaceae bacterium]|jgi:uncharacterized protein with FMN-binding domain|nr:hypothetical protein [Gaiellaceae bacterium]MDX6472905.1 hypothetical protein [Gaiellaceae bacterium]